MRKKMVDDTLESKVGNAEKYAIDIPDRVVNFLGAQFDTAIRATELSTGKPTQLIVLSGEECYLIGDLTKRQGRYAVKITTAKLQDQTIAGKVNGDYNSFTDMKKILEECHLLLIPTLEGWVKPSILGINFGRGGGQQYIGVGRITAPLLQPGERITISYYPMRK